MTTPTPTATFSLTAPISPGASVPVQLSSPVQILQVGDVLILDIGQSTTEACVVATTSNQPNPSPAITLQNVINAHNASGQAVLGLTIEEQRYMPASRPITFLSRAPLMNVISGVGRYGYGRRGDHADYNMEQFNLLAAVSKFGVPVWELFQQNYPTGWDAADWPSVDSRRDHAGLLLGSEAALCRGICCQCNPWPDQKWRSCKWIQAAAAMPEHGRN